MMNNEDIGWLKANVELILENQVKHDIRLDKLEEQISIYKTLIKVVKFVGYSTILILTFKFGDVSALWQRMFSG